MTSDQTTPSNTQPSGQAPDAPVAIVREVSETEELAVRLMSALDALTSKEEEIASLRVENGRLAAQINAMERRVLAERFGLQGNIRFETQAGKRTITQIVPADPNGKQSAKTGA